MMNKKSQKELDTMSIGEKINYLNDSITYFTEQGYKCSFFRSKSFIHKGDELIVSNKFGGHDIKTVQEMYDYLANE